ncbi:MAG: DinB family protein [Terriglobales bacterium]
MLAPPVLRQLYDYNYWARDRQLDACRKLSEEQFTRKLGGSFASIRDTLVHVAGAEWIWCERWNGRSPRIFPKGEQFPNLGAVEKYWRGVEQDVRAFVGSVSEPALLKPLTYTNMAGEQWTYPLWQAMFHLVNHGTYHRGQVTTLLRQLGAEAEAVDFLVMVDRKAAAKGK